MAEIRIRNYPIISGITCQFVLAKGRGGSKVEKCWVYAKEARAFLANLERQVNKMPQLRRHLRMPLGLVKMQIFGTAQKCKTNSQLVEKQIQIQRQRQEERFKDELKVHKLLHTLQRRNNCKALVSTWLKLLGKSFRPR